jgi:hypothetical protein
MSYIMSNSWQHATNQGIQNWRVDFRDSLERFLCQVIVSEL